MIYQLWRRLRRKVRNWGNDPTRADRNAVIQRVVKAAAEESKDKASAPLGRAIERTPTPAAPTASPIPAAAHMPPTPPAEPELSKEAIDRRAFDIWVRNGRPNGTADSDHRQAIDELRAEARQQVENSR
jgi:hypothetical protein